MNTSPANGDPLIFASKQLQIAEESRQSKNLNKAISICQTLLNQFPDYVGALHTLGISLADAKQYEEAVTVLSKASILCPHDWKIHTALSGVCIKLGIHKTAMNALDHARSINGDDINVIGTLAEVYRSQREYELAAKTFETVMEMDKSLHEVKFLLADCYDHLGMLETIPPLLESVLSLPEYLFAGINGLIHLPRSIYSFNDWKAVDALKAKDKGDVEKLYYIRAQRCHLSSDFAGAWRNLDKANEGKRRELAKDAKNSYELNKELLKFVKSVPESAEPTNPSDGMPISLFILGASRSGKTTLEYLLGRVPAIKRGYENPILENAVVSALQTSGCITRSSINGMPPGLDPVFRDFYEEELANRAGHAKVFTNTHPGKIGQVPRFGMAIRGARFVFVKRDIYDTTLRIYMKNYDRGNAWSYDIGEIFNYINWYHEMIDACAQKMDKMSLVVNYEEMIADPAGVIRSVCELCGIEASVDFNSVVLGDDRGIAQPYEDYIKKALAGGHS